MSTVPFVHTDVDGAVRAWARAALGGLAGRVFFAPNNAAPFPQVVVNRLPSPDWAALYQFDVWADNLAAAQSTAITLSNALEGLATWTSGATTLKSATVLRRHPQPDPESDKPRVVVDATVAGYAAQ
jgi:hypothetical protein